jgi:WhiB family redox-sensing transcriptional regulator
VGLFVIGRTSDRQMSRGYATQTGGSKVALTWIRTHDWDAEDWRNKASCRDTSPELFFPIGTTGLALDQIDAAKQVCEACPVTRQCLEFALATNQEAGVWGGTTEDERRRLRKGLETETTTTATRPA